MTLKFHTFIQQREEWNTGIYVYIYYLFIYLLFIYLLTYNSDYAIPNQVTWI